MTPARPQVPPPRHPGRYAVALVCLGNICRSPTAHVVLAGKVADAGLVEQVRVASGGTGGWHVGGAMDPRAAATLTAAGYDATRHRARQYDDGWADEHDLVLAMDHQNLADLRATSPGLDAEGRLRLFRDHDPLEPGGEVPDPYYGGDEGFEEVLAMVERTSDALVAQLARAVAP